MSGPAILAALLLTQLASIALCLAMPRHRALLGGRRLETAQSATLRWLGYILLAIASVIFLQSMEWMRAVALFFGWFTVTILVMALLHTWVSGRE
ncbi:MAG: DUF3325 family protein [Pseudomonadota bacterium]